MNRPNLLWIPNPALLVRALRFFSYLPLLGLSAAIALVKLIVYARLVSAEEYGAISQMFLIGNTFGAFGGLGFYLNAQRELPSLFVRRRLLKMAILETQGILVTSFSAAACIATFLLFEAASAPPPVIGGIGVAIGLFYGWAQACFVIVNLNARSRLEMISHSRDLVIRAAGSLAIGIVAIRLGYHSRTIVLVESLFTLASFLWIARGIVLETGAGAARLAWMAAWRLKYAAWRAAVILMFSSLFAFFSNALDRWLAATFLDLRQFGYYAFAWTPIAAGQALQYLIGASVVPLIARRYWAASARGAFRLTAAFSLGFAVIGLVSAVAIYPFIATAIGRWFPQQISATTLVEPLLFAAIFRVADFWSSFLIVVRQEALLLNLQIASLVIAGASYSTFTFARDVLPTAHSLAILAAGLSIMNFMLCGAAAWLNRGVSQA